MKVDSQFSLQKLEKLGISNSMKSALSPITRDEVMEIPMKDRGRTLLSPCPFCGGRYVTGPIDYDSIGDYEHPHWKIWCNTCPIEMVVDGESPNEIMLAWNKRAYYVDDICNAAEIDEVTRTYLKLKYGDEPFLNCEKEPYRGS